MNGTPAEPTEPAAPAEPADPVLAEALRTEQAHLDRLYTHLDAARERAHRTSEGARHGAAAGGTHQVRLEREVRAREAARHAARLGAVERGLCFGRLDERDGTVHYIGRTGLTDEAYEPLLLDWRAPAARPFYTATPARPGAVVRRRHLHTEGRTVTRLDDEALDLSGLGESGHRTLVGEAALLAALARERTGRMGAAVATIQAEQDRVIRSPLPGALVVQGGPGTGKTLAALHRAAYLLFTHRAALERRGVLVIGPTTGFLRYIEEVLPALGETEVVLRTVGELFPDVTTSRTDAPATAVAKGGPWMAEVLQRAVAAHQSAPAEGIDLGDGLRVSAGACAQARSAARGLRAPHNRARAHYLRTLLDALAIAQALSLGRPYDEEEAHYAPRELWARAEVRAALDPLWPALTPQQLLERLLTDGELLAQVAPEHTAALLRPPGAPWTVEDVPLLDEAAELLGELRPTDRTGTANRTESANEAEEAEELAFAQGVLTITGQTDDVLLDAAALAGRFHDDGPYRSTAERAGADRTWAYGHVVVDEAQELSAMAWRAVLRRIPTNSLTVVGDLAQAGSPAGARSWAQMLDPHLSGRWREERLTVNYRTPGPIMALAAAVLRTAAPDRQPPESVRPGTERPRAVPVPNGDFAAALAELPTAVGTLGVIAANGTAAAPGALTVAAARGLEFDNVVVVEPAALAPRDLYVALTRATRTLTLLHHRPLPPELAGAL
ncbi:HelD family protein [Kitasatospora sp. NPDC059648]|uniref:HelD family protein n=1 Tax=Kitasatospora sp. NPDC059648 TaxID=3346894 RepID=UPI0036A7E41C